jgi:hypothetical protein
MRVRLTKLVILFSSVIVQLNDNLGAGLDEPQTMHSEGNQLNAQVSGQLGAYTNSSIGTWTVVLFFHKKSWLS